MEEKSMDINKDEMSRPTPAPLPDGTSSGAKSITSPYEELRESSASRRLSIGIYGGTFNPLHNGHIALARSFLQQAGLDEVWFVVSPQNPFKINNDLLDDNIRLEMVREALHGESRIKVSDVEFHLPKPSYMYRTLRHLSADYPGYKFTLLIGGDNWKAFDRWKNADEIIENYEIAVYPRKGDNIDATALPSSVMLLDTPLIDISSTEIRQRVRDGKPIDNLVPKETADFIEKNRLYRQPFR